MFHVRLVYLHKLRFGSLADRTFAEFSALFLANNAQSAANPHHPLIFLLPLLICTSHARLDYSLPIRGRPRRLCAEHVCQREIYAGGEETGEGETRVSNHLDKL